jgi:hypothetical protein
MGYSILCSTYADIDGSRVHGYASRLRMRFESSISEKLLSLSRPVQFRAMTRHRGYLGLLLELPKIPRGCKT